VTFEPSYAYSETPGEARVLLRKRCPAWCDRVLLNAPAHAAAVAKAPVYGLLARDACVGDHKPVYAAVALW
jgi:inositol-1,4,5-trisphosphate 5-phosphatase